MSKIDLLNTCCTYAKKAFNI